jgi:YHS domain-containing protein
MIVNCSTCDKEVNKKPSQVKAYKNLFCSRECAHKHKARTRVIKSCACCGKEVSTTLSEYKKSKKGNVFCNRSCATVFNNTEYRSGTNNPNWKNVSSSYRFLVFKTKAKVCERCGYNTIPEILQVHHKDMDRTNNVLENLEILCPNCHAEEHWGPEGTQRTST